MICLGLKAVNACYSCLWCKCPNTDRHNLDKKWSISNAKEGTRSIEELTKEGSKHMGVQESRYFHQS